MSQNYINVNISVDDGLRGSEARINDLLNEQRMNFGNTDTDDIKRYQEDEDEDDEEKGSNKQVIKQVAIRGIQQALNTTANAVIGGLQQKAAFGGDSAKANALNNTISAVSEGIGRISNIASWGAAGGGYGLIVGLALEAYDLVVDNRLELAKLKWELQSQMFESDKKSRRLGILTTARGRASTVYKL